jgi:hypothetical protein
MASVSDLASTNGSSQTFTVNIKRTARKVDPAAEDKRLSKHRQLRVAVDGVEMRKYILKDKNVDIVLRGTRVSPTELRPFVFDSPVRAA